MTKLSVIEIRNLKRRFFLSQTNLRHCLTSEQILVHHASWYTGNRAITLLLHLLSQNGRNYLNFVKIWEQTSVVIKSQDKNQFVYDLLRNTGGDGTGWIALYRKDNKIYIQHFLFKNKAFTSRFSSVSFVEFIQLSPETLKHIERFSLPFRLLRLIEKWLNFIFFRFSLRFLPFTFSFRFSIMCLKVFNKTINCTWLCWIWIDHNQLCETHLVGKFILPYPERPPRIIVIFRKYTPKNFTVALEASLLGHLFILQTIFRPCTLSSEIAASRKGVN